MLLYSWLTSSQEVYPVSLFSFSGPTKKMSKNQILPQKETKMCSSNHSLPMMLQDFWISSSASFIAPLLWLIFDINFLTNPFSYKSSSQQKTAPAQKKKCTNKKNLPPLAGAPRLHWHLRYWCQWGFRIRPQEFSGMAKNALPKNERLAHENMFFSQKEAGSFFPLPPFFQVLLLLVSGNVDLSSIISFDECRCEDRLGGWFYPATAQRSDRMMDNALIWGNS